MAARSAVNDVEVCEVCGHWRFVIGGHFCKGSRVDGLTIEAAELAGRDGDTTHA